MPQLGYDPRVHSADVQQALGRIHLPLSRIPVTALQGGKGDPHPILDAQRSVVEGVKSRYGCGETVVFRLVVMTEQGALCRSGIATSRITCSVMPQVARALSFPDPKPIVEFVQPGTFEVTFVCSYPCVHELFLAIDGEAVPSCPATFTVTPGRAHATQSVIKGPSEPIQRGLITAIVVIAADEFGHRCVDGGDLFGFKAIGDVEITEVVDENNGQYVCKFAIHQGPVGIEVLLNGVPVAHSPWFPSIADDIPAGPSPTTMSCDPHSLVSNLKDEFPVPPLPRMPRGMGNEGEKSRQAQKEWQKLLETRQEMGEYRDSLAKRQRHLSELGDLLRRESLMLAERAHQTMLDKEDAELIEKRLCQFRDELSRCSDINQHERVYGLAKSTQAKLEQLEAEKIRLELREAHLDNRMQRTLADGKQRHAGGPGMNNADHRAVPGAVTAPNYEDFVAFRRENSNGIVDGIGRAQARPHANPLDRIPQQEKMPEDYFAPAATRTKESRQPPPQPHSPLDVQFSASGRSAAWQGRDDVVTGDIPRPPDKPPNLPQDARVRDFPHVHTSFASRAAPLREVMPKPLPANSLEHIGYAMEDLFEAYALEGKGDDRLLHSKDLFRMFTQAGVPLSRRQFEQALRDAKVPQVMAFDDFVEALISVAIMMSPLETQAQAVADLFAHRLIPLSDGYSRPATYDDVSTRFSGVAR